MHPLVTSNHTLQCWSSHPGGGVVRRRGACNGCPVDGNAMQVVVPITPGSVPSVPGVRAGGGAGSI